MSLNTMRPSIRQLSSVSRSFSTTAAVLSNHIPPESPSYIRLPDPPQSQSDEAKRPRVRGYLPVPREIFPRSEGKRKLEPEYITKTVPKRSTEREPINEAQRWRSEMANARRSNLEESLKALWKRRAKTDKDRKARVERNFRENNEAGAAPEREDDRLTRSTVLDAMLDTKVYLDHNRFARIEKGRARIAAKENAKAEARRDALMELYINASNFIVHESELREEIDSIFTEDYFRKQGQAADRWGATENVWGVYGKPLNTGNMLATTTGTVGRALDHFESEYDRSVNRQKKIAEELTGGKME